MKQRVELKVAYIHWMNTTFAAGRSMFDKGWSKTGKRGEGPGRR